MSKISTTPPTDLRTLITEALQAYKLAQATRIQMERAAQQEHQQHLAAAESAQQVAIQQLESERHQSETQTVAEQERLSHLLAMIQEVEQDARDLLHKASLAHIAGAPFSVDAVAASVRRADEQVAAAFAAVQLATADLQAGLLRLAQAFIDSSRWEEARRVLQPLLSDTKSTWYTNANKLLCESYYIPAVAALKLQDWAAARQGFEAVLKINPTYRDACVLLRESFIGPAELASKTQHWDEVRHHTEAWMKIHGNNDDVDARKLLLQAYLQTAQTMVSVANFEEASILIQSWVKTFENNSALKQLLCEAHYQLGIQAAQSQMRDQVADQFRAIWKIDSNYKDIKDWSQRYSLPPWRTGQVACIGILRGLEPVQSIAFSPDGETLASASFYTLTLWNIVSQKEKFSVGSPKHVGDEVLIKQINFYDRTLIQGIYHPGDKYKNLRYYFSFEIKSRQFQVTNSSRPNPPNRQLYVYTAFPIEYKPGKPQLIVCDEQNKEIVILVHPGGINDIAVSPDGTLLATAGEDGTVRLWGPKT